LSLMPRSEEEKILWAGSYSVRAGAPLYLLGALLLAVAATINWYLVPEIRRMVFYAFIGEILARYVGVIILAAYILAALGFAVVLIPVVLSTLNEYTVTEGAVTCKRFSIRGVKTQTVERKPGVKISRRQGPLAKLLNYGDIILVSESSTLVLLGVARPAEVEKIISK